MSKLFLEIGDGLRLPATEAVTQTLVVYGGKGMGKTNLAAVLAEECAACHKRFCIVDPVGVSWGLRHGANGKGQGLDVLILGGLHGDLPIEPTGGAVVADFVADEEQDTVVDISRRVDGRMWSNADKIRFVTAFAIRLYERQGERRRPIMLMIDEAGRFVPQQITKGAIDIPLCVGAIEQLVELGRNVGVGVTLITQRSARMAKSVSELAECMIAFRTVGPNSVDAILDWFGEHVEKARWKDLVEQLRQLPRGQALVVSPGWLKFEGVARIRKRETFDSSSTPTGEEKRLAKRAARPDLDKYRTRIAETVEKAEATDPSKLRAKLSALEKRAGEAERRAGEAIARLEAERAKPKAPTAEGKRASKVAEIQTELVRHRRALEAAMKILLKVRAIDFNVDSDQDRTTLERAVAAAVRQVTGPIEKRITALVGRVEGIRQAAEAAEKAIDGLLAEKVEINLTVRPQEPFTVSSPAPTRSSSPPRVEVRPAPAGPMAEDRRISSPAGPLKKHVVGILTVLAQYGPRDRASILILAGYSPSGDISTAFAGLLDHGLIRAHGAHFEITAQGLEVLGPVQSLPTGDELRAHTIARASTSAERKILAALFAAYPDAESRAQLHERAALKPSGDTSTAFGKLLRLGWAVERDGGIAASEEFFA